MLTLSNHHQLIKHINSNNDRILESSSSLSPRTIPMILWYDSIIRLQDCVLTINSALVTSEERSRFLCHYGERRNLCHLSRSLACVLNLCSCATPPCDLGTSGSALRVPTHACWNSWVIFPFFLSFFLSFFRSFLPSFFLLLASLF
jgi:hypothetical protein